MCLYFTEGKNPRYKKNKKNGGIIPPVSDKRLLTVPFTCGNCIECRKKKAREWQVRLLEDIKEHTNGQFVTLKFSNEGVDQLDKYITKHQEIPYKAPEGYDRDNKIAKVALRLFNERWRRKHKKAVRHFMVTELGHQGTENIHMHGIIWTDNYKEISRIWNNAKEGPWGFIWDGYNKNGRRENYVNETTIGYMTKYIHKIDKKHRYYKSRVLSSPGVGRNYITGLSNKKNNEYNNNKTDETYRTRSGHKIPLPQYWRNKLYTDEEKERLWINKLDKNEKWVCGEKVDISENEIEYWKLLDYHRKRNTELGYGDDKKGTAREWDENERRKLLLEHRKQNTHKYDGLAGQAVPTRRGGRDRDMERQPPAGRQYTDKKDFEETQTNAILAHYNNTKNQKNENHNSAKQTSSNT